MSIIVDDDGIMHKVYTEQEVIDMFYDITHQIQEIEKTVDSNTAAYWWKEGVRGTEMMIMPYDEG